MATLDEARWQPQHIIFQLIHHQIHPKPRTMILTQTTNHEPSMQGYQTIPNTFIDVVEIGSAADDVSIEPPPAMPPSSLLAKFGYIFLGIVMGYSSSGGAFEKWSLFIRGDNNDVQSMHQDRARLNEDKTASLQNNANKNSLINGKSFLESLPFEEVFPLRHHSILDPLSWNPAQPRPNESKQVSDPVDISDVLSSVREESTSLSVSSVSSSLVSPLISTSGATSSRPTAPHILYHAHPSAFSLLYDSSNSPNYSLSEYSLDYFLLNSGGFDAQINQAYCAVASVAALLNSLKYAKRFRDVGDVTEWSFDLPIDFRYNPYPYATQEDILSGDCVWNNVIEHGDGTGSGMQGGNVDGIFKPPYGLSLEQASKLLKCHTSDEWVVTVQEMDPSHIALSKMRFDLKAALIDPDARVMINYDRKGVGQVGGGHFSPLGAYHAPTE